MSDDNTYHNHTSHLPFCKSHHPDLLTSHCDISTCEMASTTTPQRVLRKDVLARTRKMRRFRRSLALRLGRFGNTLFESFGDESQQRLFTCPVCRDVFRAPVTVECGHTFCAGCLPKSGKCGDCKEDIGTDGTAISIVLKDLVGKVQEMDREELREICDFGAIEAISAYGIEPRYRLRSRFAGLQVKNSGDAATNIVTRFFHQAKDRRNSHKNGRHVYNVEGNAIEETCGQCFTHTDISSRERLDLDEYQRKMEAIFDEIAEVTDTPLTIYRQHLTKSDFECIICSRCFNEPITIKCGHTFCRECLIRTLDYGLSCPLCVTPLTHSELKRSTTRALEEAISKLFPEEYEERKKEAVCTFTSDCGDEVPVFICTNAYPGVACPLYVYEPRYRLLTRRCLQSAGRRFAMVAKEHHGTEFAAYGTVLEVRDAVLMENGQYILTTVGYRRFKVLHRGEQDGYHTARVQYIKDKAVPTESLPDVVTLHEKVYLNAVRWVNSLSVQALAEVERLIGPMPKVEKNWVTTSDGPKWMWWLMPILPLCKQLQVGFLSCLSVEKRLRALDKMLEQCKLRMKELGGETINCSTGGSVEAAETCNITETNSMSVDYAQ